jgi:hypothetical protein
LGSPNTPRIEALGRNPGTRYRSTKRLRFAIAKSCQVFPPPGSPQTLARSGIHELSPKISSTRSGEDPKNQTVAPLTRPASRI